MSAAAAIQPFEHMDKKMSAAIQDVHKTSSIHQIHLDLLNMSDIAQKLSQLVKQSFSRSSFTP